MKNVLRDKSYASALRIVRLYKYLNCDKHEFVISQQVLRCGTAVGALVRESEFGQSKADFINKRSIALKEANETDYWLSILKDSEFITQEMYESIRPDVTERIRLLAASVKTARKNKEK